MGKDMPHKHKKPSTHIWHLREKRREPLLMFSKALAGTRLGEEPVMYYQRVAKGDLQKEGIRGRKQEEGKTWGGRLVGKYTESLKGIVITEKGWNIIRTLMGPEDPDPHMVVDLVAKTLRKMSEKPMYQPEEFVEIVRSVINKHLERANKRRIEKHIATIPLREGGPTFTTLAKELKREIAFIETGEKVSML
jgi:hypothetical protein